MNFFKSILSDDPDPQEPANPQEIEEHSPSSAHGDEESETDGDLDRDTPQTRDDFNSSSSSSAWSFGGLIKTLATKSESVIEVYRRDLEEFGSGLKKETELFREVASRAVKELPASIEVGSVSKTIDGVLKSTAEMISQGKDTLLSDAESETPDANRGFDSRRYSRFDAQLIAIQTDPNTFTDEPEDFDEYLKWKSEFKLNDRAEEIESLIGENGALEGVYKRVVPTVVDEETFWYRYFYRVHKLKQQESVRANLVRRAISVDDDEELSWDVDDDDEDDNDELNRNVKAEGDERGNKQAANQDSAEIVEAVTVKNDEDSAKTAEAVTVKNDDSQNVIVGEKEESEVTNAGSSDMSSVTGSSSENSLPKDKENAEENSKGVENSASVKPVVQEEDDFGWDEIEDIESIDDKKLSSHGGSINRAELRKKLAEDDDENLCWDIEDDDDEPAKA